MVCQYKFVCEMWSMAISTLLRWGQKKGALIQGQWYMHVLSLLTSTSIGMCTYYVQPLQVHRNVHVPWYKHVPASKQLLLVCARTSRIDLGTFIKFRGCLEAASECTNIHGPCFTTPRKKPLSYTRNKL